MKLADRYTLMERAAKVGLYVAGARERFARVGYMPTKWTGHVATAEYAWPTIERIVAEREAAAQ